MPSTPSLLSRRDIDFLLYEWLKVDSLTSRPRYCGHSREIFDCSLDLYQKLAENEFAPHNQKNDTEEPKLVDTLVVVIPEVGAALRAFSSAGLVAAVQDESFGGMQLPNVVERAGMAYMFAANPGTTSYAFLSMANANLLLAHGSEEQKSAYAMPILQGRYYGTMCMSEPHAGSSLADIKTRASAAGQGTYRITGSKMWISGGDHELSENIVHLVLAKITDEHGEVDAGVDGISLFIVPKLLAQGMPNDVATISLNHKMGFRGTTNCALNFGDGLHQPDGSAGAVAFLLGEPGRGLSYMFHMMNEARIGIGLAATAIGYRGYLQSVHYARERIQGRSPQRGGTSDGSVPIIEHADVRRMLLAQKAYVEGGLALSLFSAYLVDEQNTGASAEARTAARDLLDLITPVSKSWPSQWCLAANDLAIQVHGGYGYARDTQVEQFFRDNRLNAIHEGTHGIQAIDLLGRKIPLLANSALRNLEARMASTIDASRGDANLAEHGEALADIWGRIKSVTEYLNGLGQRTVKLANATAYLETMGHAIVAWLWLSQAVEAASRQKRAQGAAEDFYAGKLQACRYFFRWELPRVDAWLKLLRPVDTTCLDMQGNWF
jgi:alkylation response protein AidB-like acyl-CoA dehydrogenase